MKRGIYDGISIHRYRYFIVKIKKTADTRCVGVHRMYKRGKNMCDIYTGEDGRVVYR